jgi:hypothetical protein
MINERPWTAEEIAEMPEHALLGPPPSIGQRVKARIPKELLSQHGGHRWLVITNIQDVLAPMIAGKLSSRFAMSYMPRELEPPC